MDEVFDIRIEKLVYGGDGLGRLDGQAVFVPMSAPGDLARVRTVERKKGYLRAELVEVLEPGAVRRTPPCPHYGTCGGCQLQHVDYAAQRSAKAAMVRETLNRLARIELADDPRVVADDAHEFGYRIRASAHIAQTRNGTFFGFHAAKSNHVVDVPSCMLLVPELDAAWRRARESAASLHRLDTLGLDAGDNAVSADPPIAAVPSSELEITVAGLTFSYPGGAFFQVNRPLLDRLVADVTSGATGDVALDLYSGVGLFSLPLARSFQQVIGVESNAQAVASARANAARNGCANVEFIESPVEEWLARSAQPVSIDFAIVDPPRAGVGADAARRLAELAPTHIVYVSCDPSTLARDLKILLGAGYTLESVVVFDLFPQTYHIETVARLVRTPPGA